MFYETQYVKFGFLEMDRLIKKTKYNYCTYVYIIIIFIYLEKARTEHYAVKIDFGSKIPSYFTDNIVHIIIIITKNTINLV